MKIGLDFGTTNSILSFLGTNNEPEAYSYPPVGGEKYIPSFIAYDPDGIEIGSSARKIAVYEPSIETYGNFKMRLPLPESEFTQYFRNNRTPISVTIDYLRELLISPDNDYSFSREKGEITGLVVSVPEIWQRDIYNLGRERLQELIKQDLGLEKQLIQLVSEPVAAASYYAWEMQRRAKKKNTVPFSGNLLVCDMGGGTFDVSLCRIYGNNKIEVIYFDGEGDKGLESAGVAFDKNIIQTAYQKKNGRNILETDSQFTRLLREFENTKIASHVKATKRLKNYLAVPEEKADDEAYRFGDGYSVSLGEVKEAFAPIAQGIKKVMERVLEQIQIQGYPIDRLFMVGGFSQFILVQEEIKNILGFERNDPRIEQSFNITNSAYAISYGACLIANSLVEPTEKYVHTLGIILETIALTGEKEKIEITLIEGGSNLDSLAKPNFYSEKIIPIERRIAVTLWIQIQSKGVKHQNSLADMVELPNYSPSAKYRVGMKVDRSQIAYLVIESQCGASKIEYELGNIISKMFPGHILRPDE
ncbi:MAG: Hsp70 family protein [Okeania sp. SIO3B3]|nr:Hsp70 family protein [Okeania sp. SIO3B3]